MLPNMPHANSNMNWRYLKGSKESLRAYYSCGLSTATIEYSCPSVYLCVCLSVCVHDNSKNNGSIHLKLEHIVAYESSSDKFNIRHCLIKVKATA